MMISDSPSNPPTEPNLDYFLTVSVWYGHSEASYCFGPFTEAEAEIFIEALPDDQFNSSDRVYVNHPSTYGTGLEIS